VLINHTYQQEIDLPDLLVPFIFRAGDFKKTDLWYCYANLVGTERQSCRINKYPASFQKSHWTRDGRC